MRKIIIRLTLTASLTAGVLWVLGQLDFSRPLAQTVRSNIWLLTAVFGVFLLLSVLSPLFFRVPKRFGRKPKVAEVILDGNGEPTGKLFNPADFKGYSRLFSEGVQTGYANNDGTVITTMKYTEKVSGKSAFLAMIHCLEWSLLFAVLSAMLWTHFVERVDLFSASWFLLNLHLALNWAQHPVRVPNWEQLGSILQTRFSLLTQLIGDIPKLFSR